MQKLRLCIGMATYSLYYAVNTAYTSLEDIACSLDTIKACYRVVISIIERLESKRYWR